ncbi:MAG: glycosyltransferase [Candidatus Omnitrophica bacterium]|nr:glycosyltransferase [Candidatus Omnitrophota bacterium]MBU1926087.1 glycosyltransferase [Candidatus Omnitrophota bacterium]
MKVSVIITTKNEQEHIENCLKSIKSQSFNQNEIELIVVDNNSADKTKEIASKYTDKVYAFGPERSAQRNFGIRKAMGQYVLYLDADMILSKDVIKECIQKIETENCIALYIPERIVGEVSADLSALPRQSYWILVRDFERSFYSGTVIDAVRFVRKDKILEINGFDESFFTAEDWDLDRRIKEAGKVGIIKSHLYHNESNFKLIGYIKKKSYYSKNLNHYIAKWGKNDEILKKQLGFGYRYFGVYVEQGKWIKLLIHPFLAAGMYFLKFALGLIFLFSSSKNSSNNKR